MASTPESSTAAPASMRRPVLLLIAMAVLLACVAAFAYWLLVARHYEDTDDAYVNGRLVTITSQVTGTVVAIGADENELVAPGQMLVRLDPADLRTDLARAQAQLAQAVRETRSLYASGDALQAAVAERQNELARAQDDLARRRAVRDTGAVSLEDVRHAELAVTEAEAALQVAREQLRSNRVLTAGVAPAAHPAVLAAGSRVRESYLALRRAEIPAPIAGQIARRSVQVGQRITPGTPLMTLVPMSDLWVDANFKEVQLRTMRLGQPVELTADTYGGSVRFHGRVASFAAGTGSSFALIPAQNATGNWIKVVQRVPVRIALDPRDLADHPLRVGLSMHAVVDVRGDEHGAGPRGEGLASNSTRVYEGLEHEADALVQRIIAENTQGTGAPATPVAPPVAPPAAAPAAAPATTPAAVR